MRRIAADVEELISTIYTDAEYRAMIEEQHWGLMRRRYQGKPKPLPTDVTIGYDGRCDDEDATDDVGLPDHRWQPFVIACAVVMLGVAFVVMGGR